MSLIVSERVLAMNTIDHAIVDSAKSVLGTPEHYIDAILAMAQTLELRTKSDIDVAEEKVIITRDRSVDARLSTMLRKVWQTSESYENNLVITSGVTSETLSADVADLIAKDVWLKRLAARTGTSGVIPRSVLQLKLPRKVLFRLTVAREQRNQLYTHILFVVVISCYLALRSDLNRNMVDNLLVAALCHDLGELYTPPDILEPQHQVSAEERRFIYVHPITGCLLVENVPGIAPDVAKAILEHQERLDGSGYPSGKGGSAVGTLGRLLAIADVSASIMIHFGDYLRLATLLRLNHRKYDQKYVNFLHEAIDPENSNPDEFDTSRAAKQFSGFANFLGGWSLLRGDPHLAKLEPIKALAERMYNLRTVVLEFGFDPDSLELPLALATEDATIAAELRAVIDELQFQLKDLGREIERYMPMWQSLMSPPALAVFSDWKRKLDECIATT